MPSDPHRQYSLDRPESDPEREAWDAEQTRLKKLNRKRKELIVNLDYLARSYGFEDYCEFELGLSAAEDSHHLIITGFARRGDYHA